MSDIVDSNIEREVFRRPPVDTLTMSLVKSVGKAKKSEYIVMKQPILIDFWSIQKDSDDNNTNSKVHVQRTRSGNLEWLAVGPVADKTKGNEKNYDALDFFLKKKDGHTVQRMDEEILKALGLKNNDVFTPEHSHQFSVIGGENVSLPKRTSEDIGAFLPVMAIKKGAEMQKDGKFQNYDRRYQTLLDALTSFCSKVCDNCDCLVDKMASNVTVRVERTPSIINYYRSPYSKP